MDLDNIFFQQDGAMCHRTREAFVLSLTCFPEDHVIYRNSSGPYCPARTCYLTSLDLLFETLLRTKYYTNNLQMISDLKKKRRQVINKNKKQLSKILRNF